jgi:arginine/lysine/ornithine decarboxylase
MLPRDAFFGPTRDVPAARSVGEFSPEQITPHPPGIPAVVPGERINAAIVEYLLSGLEAGMVLPDPANTELETIRVVALTVPITPSARLGLGQSNAHQ